VSDRVSGPERLHHRDQHRAGRAWPRAPSRTPAWLWWAARSASRICWTAARLLSASTRLLPAALLLRWLLWTWTVWGLAGPRLRAALVTAATYKPNSKIPSSKPGRQPFSKNEYVRRQPPDGRTLRRIL
jgi:hypothetical protein